MSDDKRSDSDHLPAHIQDFIFLRELSEVYLLLDHVSGRWDKSLAEAEADKSANQGLGAGWLERVCEIGWPPSGTEAKQAEEAAVLLRVKDRLNSLAKPASGATIAFTLLVAGEDNADQAVKHAWTWYRPRQSEKADAPTNEPNGNPSDGLHDGATGGRPTRVGWGSRPPTRTSLARLAYPGLITTADRFRWQIRGIIVLLLLWLIFTCTLSWNVALGHAVLRQFSALQAQHTKIIAGIATSEADAAKGSTVLAGQSATYPAAIGNDFLKSCSWKSADHALQGDQSSEQKFVAVKEIELCDDIASYRRDIAATRENLADWLGAWRWLKDVSHHFCKNAHCLAAESENDVVPENVTDEQWGGILLEVLANAVLPLCYGFLGAGAAVVRGLWGKMRDSLLSPRDLTLALGQLALGAVIGACIGLFVTPSASSSPETSGIVSSVALSASALSFIAGFGVEGVFVALESLVKRVFNLPDPTKKP